MMKRALFACITCLMGLINYAQTANLQLFYEINESVSTKNLQRLDSFLNQIKTKSININLIAYADFLYDEVYNLDLSNRRATELKTHLSKRTKQPYVNVLSVDAKGEKMSQDNQNPKGDAKQRRVDLIIVSSSSNEDVNTRPVQLSEPVKEVKMPELITNKNLEHIEIGQSIELEGVSFVPGRHILLEKSIPVLYNLLNTLKSHPNLKIEIQGHVCCIEDIKPDALDYGTNERKLSVNRAKAIFDFLLKNGIDKSRLTYKGFGRKHPKVDPETTPEEEQMNRRVEVMVVEK